MLKASWAVFRREVWSFFVSPIAYGALFAFLLMNGLSFWTLAQFYASNARPSATESPLQWFFGRTSLFFFLLFFPSALTMRSIAEEKRTGTIEPLLTAPISALSVVIGKYGAALLFWMTMWLPTLAYVWLTSRYGSVDLGVVGSSYVGIFSLGAYLSAIGIAASAITRHQLAAVALSSAITIALFVIGLAEQAMPYSDKAEMFAYVNMWAHMSEFSSGTLDSRRLVYAGSVSSFFLFVAYLAVRDRRMPA